MIGNIKQAFQRISRHINKTLLLFIIAGSVYLGLLYHAALYIFFDTLPRKEEVIIASVMIPANIILYYLLRLSLIKPLAREFKKIDDDLYYIDLFRDYTSEFVIILNEYGQIINYNNSFSRAMNLDKEDITGRPLREIFSLSHLDHTKHYRQLILDKLKEAFQGRESEVILTVYIKKTEEIQSVYLKLTPIMKDKDLKNIFVTGRLLHTDYITNQWLTSEQSHYVATNDLSLVHLFSYRLTRNLDGKLPRNEILHMQIALQEVLINAIEHGNLEIDFKKKTELKQKGGSYWELLTHECQNEYLQKRKVRVNYELRNDRVTYQIEDEGKGFDWHSYTEADAKNGGATLLDTFHGVGLHMIKKSFDRISFNEKGNCIILEKNIPTEVNNDRIL